MNSVPSFFGGLLIGWLLAQLYVVLVWGPRLRRQSVLWKIGHLRNRFVYKVSCDEVDLALPHVRFLWSLLNFDFRELDRLLAPHAFVYFAWAIVRRPGKYRQDLVDAVAMVADGLRQLSQCAKEPVLAELALGFVEACLKYTATFRTFWLLVGVGYFARLVAGSFKALRWSYLLPYRLPYRLWFGVREARRALSRPAHA